MKKTLAFALCAGLLTLLAACAATPAAPGGPQAAQTTASSGQNVVTCESDAVTGSMVHQHTICTTDAEREQGVEAIREQTQVVAHSPH